MRLALILCTTPLLAQFNYSAPTWADRMTGTARLNWCIDKHPAGASATDITDYATAPIEAALREWAKYIQVTFTPGQCGEWNTLTFSWVPAAHGDTNFTGRGIAHAFWPQGMASEPQAGDVHFLNSYDWSPPLEIYSVALHEIGHALGVRDVRGGVMDEGSWWRHLTLQTVDIEAVRRHYARRCWGVECAWGVNR